VKSLQPTITGNVGSIEETKPLDVTCTTTGSRPRATLQWTIGLKDVASNATEQFNHITASDTYTVISDLKYSVGKSDNGQVLTCKAVNVAVSSGIQATKTLNVKCKLNTVLATNEHNIISELVSVLFWYCTYNYSITVDLILSLASTEYVFILFISMLSFVYESIGYLFEANLWWNSIYL
jgi:hypothetical protein